MERMGELFHVSGEISRDDWTSFTFMANESSIGVMRHALNTFEGPDVALPVFSY
jgi:hypothetical protein